MFLFVSGRHVGAHTDGHQHGVSIQISINLGKKFLRISRIRKTAVTRILARFFADLPSFISQILDFIYWLILILILIYFELRDTENQQLVARTKMTQVTLRRNRALICRAVKRAGPSKKMWCSLLGSTKTSRFRLLKVELRFLKKFHETPFYMKKEGFGCIFVLRQWEKVSFSGWKQDFIFRVVRPARASCTGNLLHFFWLTNKRYATLYSGIAG